MEVEVAYGGASFQLFVEPGDEINMNVNAADFQNSLQFSGNERAAFQNTFLVNYNQQFAKYKDALIKYHIKRKRPNAFASYIREIETNKAAFAKTALGNQLCSNNFKSYLEASYTYWSAYYLMIYRYENPSMNGSDEIPLKIEKDYYDFLNPLDKESPAYATNRFFINFLENYYDFVKENSNEKSEKFVVSLKQYQPKSKGLIDAYFRGKDLYNALKYESTASIDKNYVKKYLENCIDPSFCNLISVAYENANRLSPGKTSPDFSLTDIEGTPLSLESMKGKVIFLDFWKSDCVSCISALVKSQKVIKEKFTESERQQIEFVYINLDESKDYLTLFLKNNKVDFGKIVNETSGFDSEITKTFNVYYNPHHILIGKDQKIAHKPCASPETAEFVTQIKALLTR